MSDKLTNDIMIAVIVMLACLLVVTFLNGNFCWLTDPASKMERFCIIGVGVATLIGSAGRK